MKTIATVIRLNVEAKDDAQARTIARAAVNHLMETFNDDGSLLNGQVIAPMDTEYPLSGEDDRLDFLYKIDPSDPKTSLCYPVSERATEAWAYMQHTHGWYALNILEESPILQRLIREGWTYRQVDGEYPKID